MENEHVIADIPQKAIIVHNGKVLVVIGNSTDSWELPGGRLHNDEEPVDGLKRELMEELKFNVDPIGIFATFVFKSKSGMHHYVVVYVCHLLSDLKEMKVLQAEIKDVKWITVKDLASIPMRQGYKTVLENFFKSKHV